ncbi:MAG TPA: hypothetical protein VNE40_01345 [Candidatus Dormibacteraeota bacterium]|nr:hypothetical protein [Candidatus Dormibacteraeota bacterium]
MKIFKALSLIFCLIILAAAVVLGGIYLANYLLGDSIPSQSVLASCRRTYQNHQVTIINNLVQPQHTSASLCDTLTITNDDNLIRVIAFGPHQNHTAYDGVTEKVLTQGQALRVVLNQAGNFGFHDHIHPLTVGDFTVRQ